VTVKLLVKNELERERKGESQGRFKRYFITAVRSENRADAAKPPYHNTDIDKSWPFAIHSAAGILTVFFFSFNYNIF